MAMVIGDAVRHCVIMMMDAANNAVILRTDVSEVKCPISLVSRACATSKGGYSDLPSWSMKQQANGQADHLIAPTLLGRATSRTIRARVLPPCSCAN